MYKKHNHYMQRRAGRRYENYIRQMLQRDGWTVDDNSLYGVHDHGIDLIASRDGVRRYIQCKGWRRTRLIHEDVVSHLYGSVAMYEGPDNLEGVEIYLYSPADLDSYTKAEVEKLHIHFERVYFPRWHQRRHGYFRSRNSHSYHTSKGY